MLGLFNPWSHRRFRDLLSTYIDDRLDESQVATLEEHLATCGLCQEELQTLRSTVSLLQALPHASPRRSFALTEQPEVPRTAPAYLWGMRATTAAASVALMLLVAGDLLCIFSRDIAPTGEIGQGAVERSESETDVVSPGIEEETGEAPSSLASEAIDSQSDGTALPDALTIQAPAEIGIETEETVPVTALEVALGSLLAMLVIVTVLATWRSRSHRPLA